MGSISRHITPLVINSLGGGHTHTRKHTDVRAQDQFQKTRRAPGLKTPTPHGRGELQSIVPGYPLQIVSVDIIGPLPEHTYSQPLCISGNGLLHQVD